MYENKTYEVIMQQALNSVPDNIDKREGSVIFNALAPFAAEMAKMYIELDYLLAIGFLATTWEDFLDLKAKEYGLTRYDGKKAVRVGIFTNNSNLLMDIPIGTRFSIEEINYVAIEKMSLGTYKMECEVIGSIGNSYFGRLFPINTVNNLKLAMLDRVVEAGVPVENDEAFRERIIKYVKFKPYSGNRADYKRLIDEYGGFSGVKFERRMGEEENVYVHVLDRNYNTPTDEEILALQEYLNPKANNGNGMGQVGIDHKTIVKKGEEQVVDIEINVSVLDGYSIGMLKNQILLAIDQYFLEVKKGYLDLEDQLIIKIAFLESKILEVVGIVDIQNTKLNGSFSNFICGFYNIPKIGEVTINEL